MVKQINIKSKGIVLKSLSNNKYKILLKNDLKIIGYISGKMRRNYIKILPGDKVKIEISPYDINKCIIKYRI
ncbi:MAG: translation initiation factor IF-1 [Candidatus Shikimatogenerans sp. AspAUS03]|uniref:Translation initiation factor IF-1 n=1 Tax=Candidatus Shikimatogenerans sp. AspAUS03 TaxID=3158563 RepID=A0AAU7QU17_9FLAO